MTFHWIPLGAKKQRSVERGAQASRDRWDSEELDIKLDMLLGPPNDPRDYQDCIRGARFLRRVEQVGELEVTVLASCAPPGKL